MIKNILFDLGGVIVDIDMEQLSRGFRSIGMSKWFMIFRKRSIKKEMSLYMCGKTSTADFVAWLKRHCGKNTTDKEICDTFNSVLVALPDHVLGMIDQLHEQHPTYLLSNINDLHYNEVLDRWFGGERTNITQHFDKVFFSHEMGLEKPDPEIFKQVIKESGIRPEETVFIDDTQENLDSAKQLGFHTLLADRERMWEKALRDMLSQQTN
ncbi:MAG: HAD family phosphatase [Paludibacteraceae bacterium]|nr:HAD family phosphatase [Paludibacteraceae bacterium]